MSVKTGTRLELPHGGQLMVTKGADGTLTDGDTVLTVTRSYTAEPAREDPKTLQLGKRWGIRETTTEKGADGKDKIVETSIIEVLVILTGGIKETTADLRLDGMALELLQPKVLPSAD